MSEWRLQLAKNKEIEGAKSGSYPPDWPQIADYVKTLASWRCERCGKAHEKDGINGFVLTVHHLDGQKWNCELWNLAALCQRCHLRVQNKVVFYRTIQEWDWSSLTYKPLTRHTQWMARHIKAYNVWAWLNDKQQIPLTEIYEKDYSNEWKEAEKK